MRSSELAQLTISRHDAVQVAAIQGEVDLSNASDVHDRLAAAVSNQEAGLVVDLSATSYLDSAGVRLLYRLAGALEARRQRIHIVVPPDSMLRTVLHYCGMLDSLPCHETLAEALDAAGQG